MTSGEKALVWGVAGIVVLGIFGYTLYRSYTNDRPGNEGILGAATTTPQLTAEELAVRSRVIDFGRQMQKVPLMADRTIVAQAMDSNYGPYVDAALLAQWKADPQNAPGRLTSSPWPDRIDITAAQKNTDGTYTVSGEVVEMASSGEVDRVPTSLTLTYINGSWLITRFETFSDKG